MPEKQIELNNLPAEIASLTKTLKQQAGAKNRACALVRFCLSDPNTLNAFIRKQGLKHWQTLSLTTGTYPDIAAWQEQIETLRYEKDHDPLTALPNRRYFETTLQKEIERCVRHKSSLVLCFLDVDDFKKINDTYGHPCGDLVLQHLANLLQQEIRGIDFPARIGGEEFAIVLPGTTLLQAQKTLGRLQKHIREASVSCPEQKNSLRFTCSFGLTCCKGTESENIEQLVQLADQAMYMAKKTGKDRIEIVLPKTGRPLKTTMVQHAEKQFLFAGIKEK